MNWALVLACAAKKRLGLSAPIVYEDFLPASAAGIFRSNLDSDTQADDVADDSGYDVQWLAGAIGHEIHDPYTLYEALSQETA